MKRLALFLAAFLSMGVALTGVVHADVNDFTITGFTADYYLSSADPQGQLDVTERISVNFTDYNHGILRALPKKYKGLPLHIKVESITSDSGAPAQYSTYTSNGNEVLKIGSPSTTITGVQEYTIKYHEDNVISFYGNHDEFYWDINGDQWEQPFTAVKATLHLPAGLRQWSQPPQCFAGGYGGTSANCTITSDGNQVIAQATGLTAGQTLTMVTGFEKGYFKPAGPLERIADYEKPLLELCLAPLLALLIGFSWWYAKGRDAKGRGTIVPEYAPPETISPLEAGTLADFKADNRDITATLIDLARRGYLKIVEAKQDKKFMRDTVSYSLVLQKTDLTGLNPSERMIMDAIFVVQHQDETVEVNSLKNKLYGTVDAVASLVDTSLTERGYFRDNPKKFAWKTSGLFTVVFLVLYGALHFNFGIDVWLALIGLVVGVCILAVFITKLPARTATGVAAREQLLGLKMYMETAEKDRLEKLEGPQAPYASNANQPVRTVELFEKLLPYAIVLGVEKQWAGKFEDIYKTPPDWYQGNWTAFNVGYFTGSLNSGFAPAMNASFTAPTSSSSSGFGGGGFSGGGGGGGGGGGW